MTKILKYLKLRLRCLIKGHNVICDYPQYKMYPKDGNWYLTGKKVRYCDRCNRAFK